MKEITDFVLIYEHCSCIHEMIKEIDYWITKGNDGSPGNPKRGANSSKYAAASLFDENHGVTDEDD